MEQKYKTQSENPDHKTYMDKENLVSPFTFERYYMQQLESDARTSPRPINMDDFKPKKFMRAAGT